MRERIDTNTIRDIASLSQKCSEIARQQRNKYRPPPRPEIALFPQYAYQATYRLKRFPINAMEEEEEGKDYAEEMLAIKQNNRQYEPNRRTENRTETYNKKSEDSDQRLRKIKDSIQKLMKKFSEYEV